MSRSYQIEDFQFFTFITGLQNKEQILLQELIDSFPFKNTHKLNIIDKSDATKRLSKANKKIFLNERYYIQNIDVDFDHNSWNHFLSMNSQYVNVIKENEFDHHLTSVHKIMTKYLTADYAIILDSDSKFINNYYITDIIKLLTKYNDKGDVAALGQIYQEAPFSLPFKTFLPQDFYRLLLSENRVSIAGALKGLLRFYLNGMKYSKSDRAHKLPRLFFSLITISREIYVSEGMFSKNLWLEIFSENRGIWESHRVMGDSGASLLYQIGMAGKKIINIRYNKYINHQRSGSRNLNSNTNTTKNWLRFDN